MTKDERLAEKSWESKGMWYNVSADHYSYVDGFLEGLKAGKDEGKVTSKLSKAKSIIKGLLIVLHEIATDEYDFEKAAPYQCKEAERFLKEKV